MNLLELLESVIETLETVETRGEKNMDALLGCIRAMKCAVDTLKAKQEGEVEGDAQGDNGSR